MDAWKRLCELGVPAGAIRPVPRGPPASGELRALVARVLDELPEDGEAPLYAWLCALRQHWPTAFERELGDLGRAAEARVAKGGADLDRYLKLRRIALANLAGLV